LIKEREFYVSDQITKHIKLYLIFFIVILNIISLMTYIFFHIYTNVYNQI